jgi:spoIIIJ-associated protein|uniref:KH domain-containing protein n=1 Tax=candidate division WOR-3 bacterium TaxID=2052148 RepID=A0A7V3UZS5_UNCW3
MAEIQSHPETGGELNPDLNPATRVTLEKPLEEPEYIAHVIEELISHIGIRAKVEVNRTSEGYLANIKTKRASAILIGRRGSTLKALQHLVRTIVRRKYPEVLPITVDVAGYLQRRDNFLRKKALAVAKIVTETGREMALDFLSEKEMAVVRAALTVMPQVRVYAVGTGSRRNVIIAPQESQSGSN